MFLFKNQAVKLYLFRNGLAIMCIGFLAVLTMNGCKTRQLASGKALLDSNIVFAPGGEFASMRIPALVMTKKGTLLAFCEGRIGTASD